MEINKKMLEEYRKTNFFRGFVACFIIIVLPMAVAFVVYCNVILKIINK